MDDRGDRVEEGERLLAHELGDRFRQRREVRGPVATITLSQSAGGRPAISSRASVTRGWASSVAVMAAAKPSRSTASAPPAGT